jgi:hypothetical protein
MSNRTPRASSLPWLLGCALLSAGLLPIPARAQEKIQSIRLGRHPGYERMVLEVSDTAEAYTTGEPKRIEIDAEPPALAPQTRDQLAALGVRLERSGERTRIIVEPAATRPWVAFRLKQGAPRIVVDLGPGAPPLSDDAEILRELAPSPPPSLRSLPDVSVTPPPPVPPAKVETTRGEVRVRVNGIDLVGLLAKGPTRDEILELDLSVRRTASGGWEAANGVSGAQKVSLRELTSAGSDGQALAGSVLQLVVERIAALYADRELFGTRVDIRQSDVDRLTAQEGPLVVHIRPYRAAIP